MNLMAVFIKMAKNKKINFLNNNCANQKTAHFFCKFAEQNNKIQWQDLK